MLIIVALFLAGVHCQSQTPASSCNLQAGFYRDSQGRCVFPTTAGLCYKNQVDCQYGCVHPYDNIPNNICRGGTCIDGQCVKVPVTRSTVSMAEGIIRQAIDDRMGGNNGVEKERFKGDILGGFVRGAFHSTSNKIAQACLLVDQCGNQRCEANADHNHGLEYTIQYVNKIYADHNMGPYMTLQDFFYLATVVAVNYASQGRIVIPYRWGHSACQCLDYSPARGQTCPNLPYFPGTMPGPEMDYEDLVRIMEHEFHFSKVEWYCLLGAHSLGRADPDATGYARHWGPTPDKLDNRFYQILGDESVTWDRERSTNGQQAGAVTDLDQPCAGLSQFALRGKTASHQGELMLGSDVNLFWNADQNAKNCSVTFRERGNLPTGGCARRLLRDNSFGGSNTAFDMLNIWKNDAAPWRSCFIPAFQKMIEFGQSNLRFPA